MNKHAPINHAARTLLLALSLTLLPLSPATAQQIGRLNESQFIQGLSQRNMRKLLLYYIENHPPSDPIAKQQIVIEQHKLTFDDPNESPAERSAALDNAITAYLQLFETADANNPRLPIWRTQFVQYLLETVIPAQHMNADLFAEFGLTTRSQKEALNHLATLARQQADLAYEQLFQLLGSIPRRADFEANFVNTGLWQQISEDYAAIQNPYYRAKAHLLASFTDDPEASLAIALDSAMRIPTNDLSPQGKVNIQLLNARVFNQLGQHDRTIEQTQLITNDPPENLDPQTQLIIQICMANSFAGSNDTAKAIQQLELARQAAFVQQNPLMLTLTYDAQFKITNDFNVYDLLLEHPAAQPNRAALASFINQRIVAQPQEGDDLSKSPPRVILAHVDTLIAEGTEALNQSKSNNNAQQKRDLLATAQAKLTEADETVQTLLTRADIADEIVGQARFKRGFIRYQAGQRLQAATAWIDMADQLPNEPQSASAAVNAFLVAQALYANNPNAQEALNLFDRACDVLLNKHATAKMPNGQPVTLHWHTYGNFNRSLKRYPQALLAFLNVNPDHPLFADAQYQSILCRYEMWAAASPDDQPRLANQFVDATERAEQALNTEAQNNPAAADNNLRKLGDTILRKTQIMAESLDAAPQARVILENLEPRLLRFDDIAADRQKTLIAMLVNQFNEIEEAQSLITQHAERFPDQAGPLTKSVLDTINRQIRTKRAANAEADTLAQTAVELAQFLLDWAGKQPGNRSDLQPYELILANQLIVAERYQDAAEILNRLAQQPGGDNNLDILYGQAQALYESGQHDTALQPINVILNRAPDKQAPQVWHAWLMRFSILDSRFEALSPETQAEQQTQLAQQIFSSIAKLELLDPDLGGPPHQLQFQTLKNKHFPR